MSALRGLRLSTRVLGALLVTLFAVVMFAVVLQSRALHGASDDYESTTYPITDLANTQRQAERLRSSVISRDLGLIELDLGLHARQMAVTTAPSHVTRLQPETAQELLAKSALIDQLVEEHGLATIVGDDALYAQFLGQVDQLSRAAKESYDREEQVFFDRMLDGIDGSSQLATALLVLGVSTFLVGVAFVMQLSRRTRREMAEANVRLRQEVEERIEGERRLALAVEEARRSEVRARSAAAEIETLHQVVLAGVGGGADEVADRLAQELVSHHGFDAIAVALVDDAGEARIAAVAGGPARDDLLEPGGPTERTLSDAKARHVAVHGSLRTILPGAQAVQVAPVMLGDRTLGALVVECKDAASLRDLGAIRRLADQLGLLLEAARAFDDQREVAERFRELDELKTEFVATVSHELRTPLTAIVGMALTLDQYWERVGEDERRDMVARMRRQARRQQRLVDDLLTISRIQQGGVTLRPESIVVADTVRAVERDLEGAFEVEVDPTLRVWADRDHVERILTNYLTNAAKYAPDAPVTVVGQLLPDGRVELAVRDAGPGVPEEFHARLFEAFTQASIGTTRTAQGVGLGLSIVRTLAEANGGEAWFRPGRPTGAVFGVTLLSPPDPALVEMLVAEAQTAR